MPFATRGQVKFLYWHNEAKFFVAEHNLSSILEECNTLEIENIREVSDVCSVPPPGPTMEASGKDR